MTWMLLLAAGSIAMDAIWIQAQHARRARGRGASSDRTAPRAVPSPQTHPRVWVVRSLGGPRTRGATGHPRRSRRRAGVRQTARSSGPRPTHPPNSRNPDRRAAGVPEHTGA